MFGWVHEAREAVAQGAATLDPAGLCRFVGGETMYAEWEVRRMALEQLFFEELEAAE